MQRGDLRTSHNPIQIKLLFNGYDTTGLPESWLDMSTSKFTDKQMLTSLKVQSTEAMMSQKAAFAF